MLYLKSLSLLGQACLLSFGESGLEGSWSPLVSRVARTTEVRVISVQPGRPTGACVASRDVLPSRVLNTLDRGRIEGRSLWELVLWEWK